MGTSKQPSFESRQLYDAILRQDLYSFVQAIFPIVSPGEALMLNWHLEAITYALTRVMRGEINRLLIMVPPRTLKSICASVAFPAFVLGHDPRRRIIDVSYSESLARKHANDCRAVLRHGLYRRLFPATRISPFKDAEMEYVTTARGFRLATSVGGTLTGRGGNLLIIDDPMKPQDAHSQSARDNLHQWYGNTLLSRLDNKAKDSIIVVAQRLHPDDLVGRLLEQDGWTILNLPAIAEVREEIPLGHDRAIIREVGDLLHPKREPREVLDEIKRSMGSLDFAAQYQQSPVPIGGNLVKWNWFRLEEYPTPMPNDKIIVSWDTAMSPSELADYSACVVLLVRGGTAYVVEVVRDRLDYPDLRRKVIEYHRRWARVSRNYSLLIENKGSGMSLIQDLRQLGIFAIRIVPDGDKVMRMTRVTARIEAGAVVLPSRAPWLQDFRTEISAFPVGRHNDQIDALSQGLDRAFNYRVPVAATGRYSRF
jgi:predicted phage terminase large subunit-like protein